MQNSFMLKIDQLTFICDFIKEKDIQNYNQINKLMKTDNFIQIKGEDNFKKVDLKIYQCLIGKLIYLSCGTRLNILFVIEQLSKYHADSRVGHFKAIKQVVRYLKETIHLDLIYESRKDVQSQPNKKTKILTNQTKVLIRPPLFCLIEYVNSNYANYPEDRKSVIKNFFLYRIIASWCSKKQYTVLTSTTNIEYIALRYAICKNV